MAISGFILFALFAIVFVYVLEAQPQFRLAGRPPIRADHILCRRHHQGPGSRSVAVWNKSGEPCKTYCKVLSGGRAAITEHQSFNNIRCGPTRFYRCVDGNCITNLPLPGGQPIPPNQPTHLNTAIQLQSLGQSLVAADRHKTKEKELMKIMAAKNETMRDDDKSEMTSVETDN